MHSFVSVLPLTTMVTVRTVLLEPAVDSTGKALSVSSLWTPDGTHVKSASSNSRSNADLSRPVTSCTVLGVEKLSAVVSFLMSFSEPAALSTLNVVQPRPLSLPAIVGHLFLLVVDRHQAVTDLGELI